MVSMSSISVSFPDDADTGCLPTWNVEAGAGLAEDRVEVMQDNLKAKAEETGRFNVGKVHRFLHSFERSRGEHRCTLPPLT